MPWLTLVQLILQYGLPFAEMVFQKMNTGGDVTQADIDALKTLAANNAQNQILAAAARAGLTPDNPLVLRLLGMLPLNVVPAPPANPT